MAEVVCTKLIRIRHSRYRALQHKQFKLKSTHEYGHVVVKLPSGNLVSIIGDLYILGETLMQYNDVVSKFINIVG